MLRSLFFLICMLLGSVGLTAQDFATQIDNLISTYAENEEFSGSVLVVDNGRVVLSRGYGLASREWNVPNSPSTLFRIASITKQFTSCLVFKFIEMGKLSLDDCLCDHITFYPEETGKIIKVRHLLTHTSGLADYTRMNISEDYYKRDDFIRQFCMGDLRFEPGKRYSYSNTGYYLLGDILERISGMSFEKLLEEYIFSPAGMKNSGVDNGYRVVNGKASSYETGIDCYINANNKNSQDMSSIVFSAGYMYSTTEDMYRFYSAISKGSILKKETAEKMFSVIAPLTSPEEMNEKNPVLGEVLGGSNIGYFGDVFIKTDACTGEEIRCYQHNGGINMYRTHSYYIPCKGRYISVLGNNGSVAGDNIVWQTMRILDGRDADKPRLSLTGLMKRSYRSGGIDAARSVYLDKRKGDTYLVSERDINAFGYQLVHAGRPDDASVIFRLLTDDYPSSYNAWDSYAENCLARGDTIKAIEYYRHSLELNPDSQSGKAALKRLGVR